MNMPAQSPDLDSYDRIIVAFSGGKDSVACVLHLLDLGVPRERIELWHHDVDGGPEGRPFMDWPVTRAYCQAFAAALGLPLRLSWKVGGFEGELVRHRARTQATAFETPEGLRLVGGKLGKQATRCQYPQVSPDLTVRWCSAYLKIDPCRRALANDPRFGDGCRGLVVTGERAEESAARARYATFEPHPADNRDAQRPRSRRHIDAWRPVHGWSTADVWATLERHRINPHPCYRVGFGRASCMFCIFGSADQFATAAALAPERFRRVVTFEALSGKTVKRGLSLPLLVERGIAYSFTPEAAAAALSETFDEPIILGPEQWTMPAGAGAESCGPT